MIDFDTFKRIFGSQFWKTLSESLVPYASGEKPQHKNQFLEQLFSDIIHRQYAASVPRAYIVLNKHNHVARIVPTFSYRDACVYFFCVKQLEDHIAVNRVNGTFGGWRLGNAIRRREEHEIPSETYVPTTSYNRALWGKNWREFQKRAFEYSRIQDFDYFLKFDIANFFDTINLHILEDKIRLATPRDHRQVVDLLFSFLGTWNRKFEGYSTKTVGLPQDEIGDCSRILANFYLQDYDAIIYDLCTDAGARYLRYADDQIICCHSAEVANHILVEACKELFKINLSVNSGKVERFESREAFDDYWAFDLFRLLEDPENSEAVNQAAAQFLDWEQKGKQFRAISVLKRLLAIDFSRLSPPVRFKLLAEIQSPEFLANADHWYLKRIAHNSRNRDELCSMLDKLVEEVKFNAFHYNLVKFYKGLRPGVPLDRILERIEELQIK